MSYLTPHDLRNVAGFVDSMNEDLTNTGGPVILHGVIGWCGELETAGAEHSEWDYDGPMVSIRWAADVKGDGYSHFDNGEYVITHVEG